jgi:hypothetical protein
MHAVPPPATLRRTERTATSSPANGNNKADETNTAAADINVSDRDRDNERQAKQTEALTLLADIAATVRSLARGFIAPKLLSGAGSCAVNSDPAAHGGGAFGSNAGHMAENRRAKTSARKPVRPTLTAQAGRSDENGKTEEKEIGSRGSRSSRLWTEFQSISLPRVVWPLGSGQESILSVSVSPQESYSDSDSVDSADGRHSEYVREYGYLHGYGYNTRSSDWYAYKVALTRQLGPFNSSLALQLARDATTQVMVLTLRFTLRYNPQPCSDGITAR